MRVLVFFFLGFLMPSSLLTRKNTNSSLSNQLKRHTENWYVMKTALRAQKSDKDGLTFNTVSCFYNKYFIVLGLV